MPFFDALLQGFDTRRRESRAEETARADREAEREFTILSALAQHPDPELASLGTAGILELAGGRKPAKGLRGFLGEMERSTFYPQLRQQLLQPSPAQEPPARAGAGALPASSPIEPHRQVTGPPSLAAAPSGAVAGQGALLPGGGTLETSPPSPPPGMPEAPLSATAGPGGGILSPGGVPPPPAPPETPAARYRRLYPTAAELAGEQAYQQLLGRLRAAFGALQQSGAGVSPGLGEDLVRGAMGVPRRAGNQRVQNARYRTAEGAEVQGAVVFDPASGEAQVEGQPVTVLQLLPNTPPRPVRGPQMAAGGQVTVPYLDPYTLEPVATFETGMPPPAQPSEFTGGITWATDAAGNPVALRPTRTGMATVPGVQPPPSRTAQADPEAVGFLRAVDRQLAALAKPAFPGMPVPRVTDQQMNAETARLTGGRYQTYAELAAAAATRTTPGAGGPPTMEDMAEQVLRRLTGGAGGAGSGGVGAPPRP